MTSEFDHEKCRQHVCTECYRYFWTVEKYEVKVMCPYCGENPVHPDRRVETNSLGVDTSSDDPRGDDNEFGR